MNGAYVNDKNYELFELDVPVAVRVVSEHVPEDVLEFPLCGFLQNFPYHGLQLGFLQIFSLYVSVVEGSQFRPDVSSNWHSLFVSWCLDVPLEVPGSAGSS